MPKNIALFIDGTWNQQGVGSPTNVSLMYDRVKTSVPKSQVTHYIRGLGTSAGPFLREPLWKSRAGLKLEANLPGTSLIRKGLGGVYGFGMSSVIKEGYAFLVQHYEPGDNIYLFGFSRGAFAVRSLACFVDEVGLLLKSHLSDVVRAYEIYESQDRVGGYKLARFLRRVGGIGRPGLDSQLPFHMVGVWDTVGALGLPQRWQLWPALNTEYHRTQVPSNVSHARHALALHELRKDFEPLLWEGCKPAQSLEQVWFAGAHADVGGGYERNESFSHALEWMVCEAKKLSLGVSGNNNYYAELPTIHNSISGFFAFSTPRMRHFLRSVTLPDNGAAKALLKHHWVHSTATLPLSEPETNRYALAPEKVKAARRDIDNRTVCMAFRLAQLLGRLPAETGDCYPGNHKFQDLDGTNHCSLGTFEGIMVEQARAATTFVANISASAHILPKLDSREVARALILRSILGGTIGAKSVCDLVSDIIASAESTLEQLSKWGPTPTPLYALVKALEIAAAQMSTTELRGLFKPLHLEAYLYLILNKIDGGQDYDVISHKI